MPRNGSGQFSAITNSWNPAINGVPATASDWQAVLNDIVSALTQSVSRDGQTAMTGNLPMAGNKVTGLGNATATGDALTFAQLFSQGQQQDVPAAATTDIGAQLSTLINVTGAATITSFGTNYNGPRFLRFAGVCTLINSATLVLPGGANITTAAGYSCIAVPLGNPATGWRVTGTGDVSTTGDQTIGGVKTFSGLINANANISISGIAPLITLVEADQASPAGRRRIVQDGNQFTVRRNTAAAGDFSTEVHDITSDASGNFTANGNITAGGQFIGNVTGNAATATALQTARNINGISFNGSADITLPTVNTTGDQTIGGNKTFSGDTTLNGKQLIQKTTAVTVGSAGGSDQWELANNSSGACVMTFHRNAAYAINMGLDTDNVFRLGGWSQGLNVHRWTSDTSGNFTALGNITAGGQFVGNVTGNVTGNAGTVTNGVYTTGDQTIGGIKTFSSSPIIRNGSPTVFFQDTDGNSAMLHCNSNLLHVLRGANDSTTWTQVNGHWPFVFNLTDNSATCGGAFTAVGNITANGQFIGNGAGLTNLNASAILNATAGAGANGVGTYAFMRGAGGSSISPGATSAGSSLEFSNALGASTAILGAGTWRCMGFADVTAGAGTTTLWLRIS